MKSQYKTKPQNVLYLNHHKPRYVYKGPAAPFKRSRGSCEWFNRHQKYVGEVSVSSFSIATEYSWALSVSTDKNLKD